MEAIIKLLILLSVSDNELHNKERKYINKIIKGQKLEIDIDAALEEINSKFRDDFDTACKFYIENINNEEIRKKTLHQMRELAAADLIVRDREIKFLELTKQIWKIG
jgi:hypothetical protein|tara:strand:- start:17 stop:337 length:321 start_codon:yes stop_codon:yes gene_type:complete